jgi:prepilin-type N-terminal cleavage/methylation domain-containing protein/prepilin-type processing-associated H-X9-DG protein
MRTETKSGFRKCARSRAGFTLLELSAVVFIIAVLTSLLSAALNHTKHKALRLSCLENVKQLQIAWGMYTDDNDNRLPLNQSAAVPLYHRIVSRKSSTNSWVTGNPLVDTDTKSIEQGSLYPYVKNVSSYRCPLDRSTVINHPEIPRTRSYAMSAYLGGDDPGDEKSRVKMRWGELTRPGNIFVFIEEDETSAWWPNFVVVPRDKLSVASNTQNDWPSIPSDRHEQGCNLSFTDGHVEYWKWYAPKKSSETGTRLSSSKENPDLRRLQASLPEP